MNILPSCILALSLPLAALAEFPDAESVIFLGETVETATARLLRTPEPGLVLQSATQEQRYVEGKDFTWRAGSRELQLTPGSKIPFLKAAQLHPAPKSPNSYASARDGKSWMLYGAGRFFHDLQCTATYASKEPMPFAAAQPAPAEQLGRVREKLKAKQPLTLVVLGDSISTGADASALAGAPPRQEGYPKLVAAGLETTFGSKITLVNLSVGGMDVNWGTTQVDKVIAAKPDLLLIAFGMNDASGRRTPEDLAAKTKTILDAARAAQPECQAILVTSMTANAEWIHASPELYPAYAKALTAMVGPGVAAADVHAPWSAAEARKGHLAITGNGLNHPNDFGHRIYASVVLDVIGGK